VVGSNIFNVLFILGLSALITPLVVTVQLIRQEVPIMIGVSLLLLALALDGRLGPGRAALLLGLLLAYTVFLVRQSRARDARPLPATNLPPKPHGRAGAWDAAAGADRADRGRPGAAGRRLARLVDSRGGVRQGAGCQRSGHRPDHRRGRHVAARGGHVGDGGHRGQRDIAVGNVVGSNVFNILGCLGLAGLARAGGLVVPPAVMAFDLWVMVAVALACLPVFVSGREIARWEGARVPGLLPGLCRLAGAAGPAAQRCAAVLGRDAGLCGAAHGGDADGGAAGPVGGQGRRPWRAGLIGRRAGEGR
jgi:cation:H+ antiporter